MICWARLFGLPGGTKSPVHWTLAVIFKPTSVDTMLQTGTVDDILVTNASAQEPNAVLQVRNGPAVVGKFVEVAPPAR